ncbi:hypothetical protein [Comamonas sp.]|uniref:hypothetical protein n=1 Tax=Comamonas sp. TaxID=34028 RepID=UPI003A9191B8
MKKHLFRHHQDTPFEVLSVVLFSVLTFGVGGAALAQSTYRHDAPTHQASRKISSAPADMLKAFTAADGKHEQQLAKPVA